MQLLWSEIKAVVTKQDRRLEGAAIRQWLKDKNAVPRTDTADVVKIKVREGIFLRTPREVTEWLQQVHFCKSVTIEPTVVPDNNRVAARGPQMGNANETPLRLEFHQGSEVITELALTQAENCRITVHLNANLTATECKVELAYIGAKIGVRPAVRSVLESEYRYLSRVRITLEKDGIQKPVQELIRSVRNQSCRVGSWSDRDNSLMADAFTVVGLEWGHGEELLQASLLDQDGKLLCDETLAIQINHREEPREPTGTKVFKPGVGTYRVLTTNAASDFHAADLEFKRIHDVATDDKATEVRVAICDTGVWNDSAGTQKYLAKHLVAGKFFKPDPREDRLAQKINDHTPDILTLLPSMHGTAVAANAAWGFDGIKIINTMVQGGQEGGAPQNSPLTLRAFKWAVEEQRSVIVNCSVFQPFGVTEVNDFVSKAEIREQTLFLTTAGNSKSYYPLDYSQLKAKSGGIDPTNLPNSLENTLLVGGCYQNRTPHESRGFGPGVDVMVPGDNMTLYCPRELMRLFRVSGFVLTRQKMLNTLDGEIVRLTRATENEPDTVPGEVPFIKQHKLKVLREMQTRSQKEQEELDQLNLLAQEQPHPEKELLKALQAIKDLLLSWDTAAWDAQQVTVERVIAWKKHLDHLIGILASRLGDDSTTATWSSALWTRLKSRADGMRPAAVRTLRVDYPEMNGNYDKLINIGQGGQDPDAAGDAGVSFGLPLVANVAAKLKLIRSTLSPNKLKRILIDTSDYNDEEGFQNLCLAQGMVNPLRAYFAAYDNEVFLGGRDVRAPRPLPPRVGNRTIFYTFYYMNLEGLELYAAIKDRLREEYAKADIDLVEAEAPVGMNEEAITYVAGKSIGGRDWKRLINTDHPLRYQPRHLRLILVNESGYVQEPEVHKLACDHDVWAATDVSGAQKAEVTAAGIQGECWQCTLALRGRPVTRMAFPDEVKDIVDTVRVSSRAKTEELVPLAADKFEVVRNGDHEVVIRLKREATQDMGPKAMIRVNVVQRLGGSRNGRNIFMSNRYHAGPNGTPDANNSTLVLFLHEIAHAIGMVAPDHALYYNKQSGGGEGDHCSFNTEDKPNAEAPTYGIPGDNEGGTVKVPTQLIRPERAGRDEFRPCVMYHTRSAVHHTSVFCATCIDKIKSLDGSKWEWKT